MTIKHEEWVRRQRAKELRDLPVPHEHRNKTLDDVRVHSGNEEAVEAARNWLQVAGHYLGQTSPEAGKGVLFFGPPGTGKTLLASVMANAVVRMARVPGTVHFVTMEGFNRSRLRKMELGRMMDSGRHGAEDLLDQWMEHDAAIERCYETRLLVLDDVGQENTTEHLARMLNELLRARYNFGRPTVITSNIDPGDWGKRFENASLASFIHQACFVVPVGGEDERAAG